MRDGYLPEAPKKRGKKPVEHKNTATQELDAQIRLDALIRRWDLNDASFNKLQQHRKSLGTGVGLQRTKQRGAQTVMQAVSKTGSMNTTTRLGKDPYQRREKRGGTKLAQTIEYPDDMVVRSDEITLATWMAEYQTAAILEQRLAYADRLRTLRPLVIAGQVIILPAAPAIDLEARGTHSLGYAGAAAWFRKQKQSLPAYVDANRAEIEIAKAELRKAMGQ